MFVSHVAPDLPSARDFRGSEEMCARKFQPKGSFKKLSLMKRTKEGAHMGIDESKVCVGVCFCSVCHQDTFLSALYFSRMA